MNQKNYNLLNHIEAQETILRYELKNCSRSTESIPGVGFITVCVLSRKGPNSNNSFITGTIPSEFDLSVEFSKHYLEIELYTKKLLNLLNNPIDLSWVLSECYLYLDTNKEAMKDTRTLISYSKNWIKQNLKWKNSPLNRMIRVNDNPQDTIPIESTNNIHSFDLEKIEDDIEFFRNSLTPYERRLFNIYYDLDLKKGKDISTHLGIPLSSAYPIIKECKIIEAKLRNHIKKSNTF